MKGMVGKKSNRYFMVFLFFVFVCFITHPLLFLSFSSKSPYNGNHDSLLMLSIINWHIHQIKKLNFYNLWHMNYFYPNSYTTFYTHHLFGHAFVLFPVALFFDSPHIRYNFLILFFLSIGVWGSFLFLKELTGEWRLSAIFASFYIFMTYNYFNFIHLNILTHMFIPFFLYFFLKYLKTGKNLYAVLTGLWSFIIFFFSVYIGSYLLGIFFPILTLVLLFGRVLNFNNILKLAAIYSMVLLSIFLIFKPYLIISRYTHVNRKISPEELVSIRDILNNMSGFSYKFFAPEFSRMVHPLSPGMVIILGVIFFLFRRKYGILISLTLWGLLVISLHFGFLSLIRIIFLILFLRIVYIVFAKNKPGKIDRSFLSFFILYCGIFFNFSSVLPFLRTPMQKMSLYHCVISLMPGMQGLRVPQRAYLLVIPLMLYFSMKGFIFVFEKIKNRQLKEIVVLLLFPVMFLENYIPLATKFYKEFPSYKAPYKFIPEEENKIILEIPLYCGFLQPRNNRYNFYSRFHWNYLVNGRAAVNPRGYNMLCNRINSGNFPDEKTIKWLLVNYSVDYIIFHWNLLENSGRVSIIRERLKNIKDHGRFVYDSGRFSIFRTVETIPVRKIRRRYATYHLRHNRIIIYLRAPFTGEVTIYLNGTFFTQIRSTHQKKISLDFRRARLNWNYNDLIINFSHDINLRSLLLTKK